MIAIVFLVVVFMAFISGSYPAIYLSGFRPAEVLKGQVVRGSGAEMPFSGQSTDLYCEPVGFIDHHIDYGRL
jgi:putative ABC transport system permease protein